MDVNAVIDAARATTTETNWRQALPVLTGSMVTLRELRLSDAPSLLAMLATEEVARFISPPPTTVEGFERFIAWTHRERAAGNYVCFGVVPHGMDTAIGIFQVRQLEPGFGTAEWGFAIGSAFWGTGVFMDGAKMVIDFAFDVVGTHRLEARAAVANGRGNGALRKVGALQEGILRKSFLRNGEYLDQTLWTILDEDWRRAKSCGVLGFTEPRLRTRVMRRESGQGRPRLHSTVGGPAGSGRCPASGFSFVVPRRSNAFRFCVSADADAVSPTVRWIPPRSRFNVGDGCRPGSAASSRSEPTANRRLLEDAESDRVIGAARKRSRRRCLIAGTGRESTRAHHRGHQTRRGTGRRRGA